MESLHNWSWFCYIMPGKERSITPSCILIIPPYLLYPWYKELFFIFDQLFLIHLKIFQILFVIGDVFRWVFCDCVFWIEKLNFLDFWSVVIILEIHCDIVEMVIMDNLRVRIYCKYIFYGVIYWVISLIKWYVIKLINFLRNSLLRFFIIFWAFSIAIKRCILVITIWTTLLRWGLRLV